MGYLSKFSFSPAKITQPWEDWTSWHQKDNHHYEYHKDHFSIRVNKVLANWLRLLTRLTTRKKCIYQVLSWNILTTKSSFFLSDHYRFHRVNHTFDLCFHLQLLKTVLCLLASLLACLFVCLFVCLLACMLVLTSFFHLSFFLYIFSFNKFIFIHS